MYGAGGSVYVHFVMLVEMFLPVSLFSYKIFMQNFLIFQLRHMLGAKKNHLNEKVLTHVRTY